MNMHRDVLERALECKGLEREDVSALMSLTDGGALNDLFDAASYVREKMFGKKVFTYGFVYFSTFCRNNCAFCNYRRSHRMERYRRSVEDIAELSSGLEDSGVNLVDLTMGEDPVMYENDYELLLKIVESVNNSVNVPIMLSPGAVSKDVFPKLRRAGADWFACYQETHNHDLFKKLRLDQDYGHRFNQRKWARDSGMLTEDGMMVGVGETRSDRINSIMEMGTQDCSQVRVMTFVPQDGTPMFYRTAENRTEELKTMAVLRLAYPDCLIPASLDVEGTDGLIPRLEAGANVVTSIVPPNTRLAGVVQKELDIDNGKRSAYHVFDVLDSFGYKAASNSEYGRFMEARV